MDEENLPEPKISDPEVILIGGIFVLFDLIEIVLIFFALDDFWIIDIIAATIFFYLFLKKVPPMRQLITYVVELLPWVGALPLLTVGWGLTVWADRHPESMLAKVGEAAALARGRGEAYGAAPSSIRGVGAKSLRRIEKAEKRATEWEKKMPQGVRKGLERGLGGGAGGGAGGGEEGEEQAEEGAPGAPQAQGAGEDFGVEPLGQVKELEAVRRSMSESPEGKSPEKKKKVAVDDSRNEIDLKRAA
ncbi:MAG: hypothetical protein AAB967_04465 [Patescibacteria group bacterium]